jgi:repressor LexA
MSTKIDTAAPTPRQQEVLDFVAANSTVSSPPIRQIQRHFKFKSPNGVVCHLKALERKGRIVINKGQARGIQVVEVQS